MTDTKADIISKLQRDILSLQGFKTIRSDAGIDMGLGLIKNAFPGNAFPTGAIHEFILNTKESTAATNGFLCGILSAMMKKNGVAIWIGSSKNIFPPALKLYGIAPDRIIFIDLKKENEVLWTMEEALKCEGLSAVIGEMQELSFTNSRRLQLAVEKSRVTGFVIRNNPKVINTTACVTRWKISSLPSQMLNEMPGVGFPRWNVELQKVRNGKPGSWQIEFAAGRFRHITKMAAVHVQEQKKTG